MPCGGDVRGVGFIATPRCWGALLLVVRKGPRGIGLCRRSFPRFLTFFRFGRFFAFSIGGFAILQGPCVSESAAVFSRGCAAIVRGLSAGLSACISGFYVAYKGPLGVILVGFFLFVGGRVCRHFGVLVGLCALFFR